MNFKSIKSTLAYPLYIIVHPADGFYGMKYEKKGKVWMIFFNTILFWVSYTFMQQYGGLVVNNTRHPMSYNSALDLLTILSMFALFSIGNWSITSLADGEGKLVDIMMAVSYAFAPMNLLFIPATILSNFLTVSESAFFGMIIGFAIVYFVLLVFMGIMTIQNYTVVKTVLTFLGTAVAILIIVFILLLVSTLMQQVWIFGRSIYIELFF